MFVQAAPEGLPFLNFILRVKIRTIMCIYKVVTDEIFLQMKNKLTKNIKSGANCRALWTARNIFFWLKTWLLVTACPLLSQIRSVQVLNCVAF